MKNYGSAPFLRTEETVSGLFRDITVMLLALLVLPTVYFGWRVLFLAAVSVVTCLLCDIFCGLVRGSDMLISDASPVVIGLTVALLLPAGAPLLLIITAAAFASLVAKAPFGSFSRAPFHPAAAAIAFVTICWPSTVFSFPQPGQDLFATGAGQMVLGEAPSATLKKGLIPDILPLDMLWGRFPGPMGATAVLIICACGLFLFIKKAADWKITASYLAVSAIYAALFPRIVCSPLTSVKYELMSGTLLFCAVFVLTGTVNSPRTRVGSVIYGALAGALTMLMKSFGAYEISECFAVLLVNALAPLIDHAVCAIAVRRDSGEKRA